MCFVPDYDVGSRQKLVSHRIVWLYLTRYRNEARAWMKGQYCTEKILTCLMSLTFYLSLDSSRTSALSSVYWTELRHRQRTKASITRIVWLPFTLFQYPWFKQKNLSTWWRVKVSRLTLWDGESLYGGSLEVLLKVPLNCDFSFKTKDNSLFKLTVQLQATAFLIRTPNTISGSQIFWISRFTLK